MTFLVETVAFGNGVWSKFQTVMFLETRSETECKLNRKVYPVESRCIECRLQDWDNTSVSVIYLLLFIIHDPPL